MMLFLMQLRDCVLASAAFFYIFSCIFQKYFVSLWRDSERGHKHGVTVALFSTSQIATSHKALEKKDCQCSCSHMAWGLGNGGFH